MCASCSKRARMCVACLNWCADWCSGYSHVFVPFISFSKNKSCGTFRRVWQGLVSCTTKWLFPPISLKASLNVGDYHPHYMMITVNLCLGGNWSVKSKILRWFACWMLKYPLKSWNIYFFVQFLWQTVTKNASIGWLMSFSLGCVTLQLSLNKPIDWISVEEQSHPGVLLKNVEFLAFYF